MRAVVIGYICKQSTQQSTFSLHFPLVGPAYRTMSPFPVILMRSLGFISMVGIVSCQGLTNSTSQGLTNTAGANDSTSAATCKRIDSQLPGRISYPADLVYSSSLSTYYSAQERALTPGCIFTPTSTADVSTFVKLVVAQNYGSIPQFAIRSGGHKYFAGAANIDVGITVDMRGLHDVSFNKDLSVISIGGGAVWNTDVYPHLVPNNLTAAGARLPGLGVGGFVSGGKCFCACMQASLSWLAANDC